MTLLTLAKAMGVLQAEVILGQTFTEESLGEENPRFLHYLESREVHQGPKALWPL